MHERGARVDANGQTRLKNTIIARPLANGVNCLIGSGLNRRPAFLSDGFNLSDDDTCGFDQMGDLNGVDALITGQMGLDDPPRTYYNLRADSPAIDAIPVDECVTVMGLRVSIDQQGRPRPRGGRCDIGAVERLRFGAGFSYRGLRLFPLPGRSSDERVCFSIRCWVDSWSGRGGLLFAFSNFVMRALGDQPDEHGMFAMQRKNEKITNPIFLVLFPGTDGPEHDPRCPGLWFIGMRPYLSGWERTS